MRSNCSRNKTCARRLNSSGGVVQKKTSLDENSVRATYKLDVISTRTYAIRFQYLLLYSIRAELDRCTENTVIPENHIIIYVTIRSTINTSETFMASCSTRAVAHRRYGYGFSDECEFFFVCAAVNQTKPVKIVVVHGVFSLSLPLSLALRRPNIFRGRTARQRAAATAKRTMREY